MCGKIATSNVTTGLHIIEREAYWYRGIQWLEWLDYVGTVERPTEDAAMRRLAFQTTRAMDHLARVHLFIFRDHAPSFRDLVREVLIEEKGKRDGWTLRQIHEARGVHLEWRTEVSKRGNVFTEVVEVELPKTA